jgi:phage host-nuclease inhibitor protein Gam
MDSIAAALSGRSIPDDEGLELHVASPKGPAEPAFCVKDADSANWVVRRIVEARAYRDRVRAWAEREVRRSERDEQRLLYLFGRQLQDWTSRELAAGRKGRRSVNLPGGTVGFRQAGPSVTIDDAAAVLEWARRHLPAAIVVREHLSRSAIVRHVRQTGELPDQGVRVEPGQDAFYIR